MSNWWDDAPLATAAPAPAPADKRDGAWWEAAPVVGPASLATPETPARADSREHGAMNAAARGFVDGIPIAGPVLLGAIDKGDALVRSVSNDTKYSEEAAKAADYDKQVQAEHPYAHLAGEVGGGIAGTAPMVAMAPAAFGAGAGSLALRAGAAALSGAALGGADSAVRSGGDAGEMEKDALLGAGLGGAGPVIGRGVGRAVEMVTGGEPGMHLMRQATRGLSEEDLAAAQSLRDQSSVPLSADEALNAATDGRAGRASQLARVAANSGGPGGQIASDFYAARPGQIDAAGRAGLDMIGGQTVSPTDLGFDAQTAARQGVGQTPQGMALQQARAAATPVTPLQAGQAVQSDLVGTLDRHVAARKAEASPTYRAADQAPERFAVDGPVVPTEVDGPSGLRTIDNGPVRAPSFDPPPAGPDTLASLAPTRAATEPTQGPSLSRYIAENGGIGLEPGDYRAADLNRWTQPGVGSLLRNAGEGKSVDGHWRADLVEKGYLPPDVDGGMQRNIHDELISALEREQRGQKVYPYDWQGGGAARDTRQTLPAAQSEFDARSSIAQSQLHDGLTQAGYSPADFHPAVLDRATAAMMKDQGLHPLDAVESAINAAHEPLPRGPSMTTGPDRIKGETVAPLWGQVDPRPIVDGLNGLARTAKGDVLGDIREALNYTRGPDGGLDMSVPGLLHARERLDAAHAAAKAVGDDTKAGSIWQARELFDGQLKQVPEVAHADARFAANSRPIEPFQGNGPLALATRREGNMGSGRLTMPAESVPDMLTNPTALNEALANGGQATRQNLGAHLQTQILAGTDGGGSKAAATIRQRMDQHPDALNMLPEVRERVNNIALAHEGMARVEASPLGRIAATPEVQAATNALFSREPGAGSHHEVASAMAALSRNNPQVAEQLARYHLENVFNQATREKRGLPGQYGGAAFASFVRGGSQQAKNLEASIRALPNGDARWNGLDRLLTTFEATGYRPQKGSDTAFNQAIQKELSSGKTHVGQALSDVVTGMAAGGAAAGLKGVVAGGGVGLKHAVGDGLARARLLNNGEAVARLLYDPKALPDLRALAKSAPHSRNAEMFSARLLAHLNGAMSPVREPARQ